MVAHAMATTEDSDTGGLAGRVRRLLARIGKVAPDDAPYEMGDAEQDELDPVLVGTCQWQRRQRYRAQRDKRVYSVESAIRHEYLTLEGRKRNLTQLHGREQDETGMQYRPDVVSIADLEAALSFIPNGREHNKARWVYALVVGREPVITAEGGRRVETYREAAPRTIGEAAAWLNIPYNDAAAGYAEAEAFLVTFLCHEGLIAREPDEGSHAIA
jgi:hypothetical protein